MKKYLILAGIIFSFAVNGKVLQRYIENDAPIDIRSAQKVEVEVVKEYETGEINRNVKPLELEVVPTPAIAAEVAMEQKQIIEQINKQETENPQQQVQQIDNVQEVTQSVSEVEPQKAPQVQIIETGIVSYPDDQEHFYYSLSLGYANTRYDELDGGLTKGSIKTQVSILRPLSTSSAWGVSLSLLHPTGSDMVAENITVTTLKPFYQYIHFLNNKLYAVGNFGVALSDHNIRKVTYESEDEVRFKKVKSGFAAGVVPQLGIRYQVKENMFLEFNLEYSFYFGHNNKYLGGLAFLPNFSFRF